MAHGMSIARVDSAKVLAWRERFERFKASERKTAQFCAAEGVSQANFYAWRRKLGLAKPRTNKKSQAFQRVMVSSVPVLAVRLPGGVEIEASGTNEQALRTIVDALVRASQNSTTKREAQRC